MNQIVRALQGSMDSLTHDAYLERRVSWRGVQQEWCLIECLTLHQGSQAREATAGRSMIGAAHSFTYLGRVVGAQSFFGNGFFYAGAPQNVVLCGYTLERHTPRSG